MPYCDGVQIFLVEKLITGISYQLLRKKAGDGGCSARGEEKQRELVFESDNMLCYACHEGRPKFSDYSSGQQGTYTLTMLRIQDFVQDFF